MYNVCIVLTDEHIYTLGYYALAACVSYDIPTKNQSVSVLPIIHTSMSTNTKVQFTYLNSTFNHDQITFRPSYIHF